MKVYKGLSLRMRFFITYIILLLLSVSIFGYITLSVSLNNLTEASQLNAYNIVKKNNQIIDVKLKQIHEGIFSFIADEEVYKTFADIKPINDYNINSMDIRISEVLNKYFAFSEDIYSAQLATSYYTFFSRANKRTSSKNFIPKDTLKITEIYKKASQEKGEILWIPTYDYATMFHIDYLDSSNLEYRHLFSVVQMLNETYFDGTDFLNFPKEVELPVLIINLQEDFFGKIFEENMSIEGSTYMIVNEEGQVVSHKNKEMLTKRMDSEWIQNSYANETGMDTIDYNGEKMLIVYDTTQVTHWMSIVMIPYDSLRQKIVPTLRNFVLGLGIALILVAIIISYCLSGMITNPMKKLSQAISKSGKGQFNTKVELSGSKEIRSLTHTFNEMNKNIQVLVIENFEKDIREKEAEILALNLQLDPHFMYNTLNLINLMLIENGQDEISELMENLSNMLKYTVKHKSGLVAFSEDMEFLVSYINIMQKRFEGNYCVEYFIDEDMYAYEVPKFLLQPFVENVFVHGFEGKSYQGKMIIRCFIEKDERVYMVEDNGVGIEKEKIEEILDESGTNIGITNIIKRINLNYGEGYGVEITSEVGTGTKVTVRLPLQKNKSMI